MRLLVFIVLKLRWWYFHIHPGYQKFTIDDELHFYCDKTNSIHSNLYLAEKEWK